MSVLVKGMDLPEDCSRCCFSDGRLVDKLECTLLHEADYLWNLGLWAGQKAKKFDGCPLVEVPTPHGRLIDEQEAYDCIAEQEGGNYIDMDAVGMGLANTSTIIEAEEGGQ